MTSPRHLWSGDWEAESAAAARERARRRGQGGEPVAAEAPPPPRADPPRQPRPEPPRQARPEPPAPRPVELRPKRPRPRLKPTVIPILVGLLVVAAAAYGLAKLADSGGSPSAAITQHTPWLGVTMETLPINRVAIAAVTPGGPADRAGLGPGDVITLINQHRVSAPGDVTAAIATMHPGDRVVVQVQRGPATYTTEATLQTRPSNYSP